MTCHDPACLISPDDIQEDVAVFTVSEWEEKGNDDSFLYDNNIPELLYNVGCVSSQCDVSSTCRMLGQASREAARSTRTHSKIQDSKESQGCRKPPSQRPRKKNKTSREVGKYQETSATSHRNRRASPRSKQRRADKA